MGLAEFVADLLCTRRMSEAEYREFLIVALESLSAKFDEKLGRDAPQGLARAAAEDDGRTMCPSNNYIASRPSKRHSSSVLSLCRAIRKNIR